MTGVDEEAHGAAKSDPAAMRLIPIVKVRDQRFPELITLGRGAENDVVMSNPSLSKIHVFFNCKEGDCTIVDSRSTNGTVVNGAVLSSIVPVSLETGAVIVFGGAFHATFNWAEDLFEYIEVLRIAKKL
jgi:pSer/pThr/pTyr-binding forkhead associated (FHA) protein